jgi:hypothetical protein
MPSTFSFSIYHIQYTESLQAVRVGYGRILVVRVACLSLHDIVIIFKDDCFIACCDAVTATPSRGDEALGVQSVLHRATKAHY